ncbi:hypothetical protein [Asticcacaulis sp. AND118]|uniref:hypothetical protein n=1 Tax=Asticcacaulis sp. AND118 TaxID=2840468 RepID=UPI001CFFE80A|nr:hypothetical protein [Asticcacaulis sp. AND118]UDF02392.1 hypothetical protein LH365_08025 [Asticcacaulis sp. AND118]
MALTCNPDRRAKIGSETRFWTMLAVVMGLLVQVLFPPHLLAASRDGPGFVLCNSAVQVVDTGLSQAVAKDKTDKTIQGLKCADCVLAGLTGLPQPDLGVIPVVYAEIAEPLTPVRGTAQPKARAPPRPHSCGPPHLV